VGDLTGLLNVNKPRGWTSHDVVARVRKLAGQRRVGHAGTLDPLAEGVLPVLLGRATRLADFIQSGNKVYRAVVELGRATETDDAEGAVVSTSAVPDLSSELLEQTLAAFHGEILQTPPKYSALKVDGRRAYAVARSGAEVLLPPRPVTIHGLRLLSWTPVQLTVEVTCSKGTYIRSLARDIASQLGTVGHLAALTRLRVGPFALADSLTPDELAARGVREALLPPTCAIPDAPSVRASSEDAFKIINGQAIPVDGLRAEAVWVYDPDGRCLCLAAADGTLLRPRIALCAQ
jgi:tRNA pseudouridine55 synthase